MIYVDLAIKKKIAASLTNEVFSGYIYCFMDWWI